MIIITILYLALIIALVFLNYFGIIFGELTRKEALNKMEEVMAKEHEMLSLGGQAAQLLLIHLEHHCLQLKS